MFSNNKISNVANSVSPLPPEKPSLNNAQRSPSDLSAMLVASPSSSMSSITSCQAAPSLNNAHRTSSNLSSMILASPRLSLANITSLNNQDYICKDSCGPIKAFSCDFTLNTNMLKVLGQIWSIDTTREKLYYKEYIKTQIEVHGIQFLELFSVLAMYETIKNTTPEDTNFFLVKLLYLAHVFGVQSRPNNNCEFAAFPYNPCMAFTFGKRIQIESNHIETLSAWLKNNITPKFFKRFSSHSLCYSDSALKEKIGLPEIRTLDTGLNLALYGKGNISPFTSQTIKDDGHFGHACIVKKRKSLWGDCPGGLLVGIESSQPLKKDQQGAEHGINCSSNPWSAFFMPKFGDSLMAKLPKNQNERLPNSKTQCLLIDTAKKDLKQAIKLNDSTVKNIVLENVIKIIRDKVAILLVDVNN